ncbi:MAG: DNA-processing protein DprA, partial [Mariprofundaceae bacterium]
EQWLRLSLVRGIGPMLGRQLVAQLGGIQTLWQADAASLKRIDGLGPRLIEALSAAAPESTAAVIEQCETLNIGILCPDDARWPARLEATGDAPLVLFVQGDTACLGEPHMLAVVGARKATQEGRSLTRRWCRYLSGHGVTIASGMAFGIDAAAHRGALEGESPTIAVLGCGLASLSEEQQRQVAAVAAQGCVLSEFLPSLSARPEHFPRRNRIIAGLAEATLVMEADIRSGSLITARQAADYGREVLAVPGSVLGGNHAGCHLLIREGAALIESADALLQYMGWQGDTSGTKAGKPAYHPASEEEEKVLSAMARDILHIDALAETCGLTVPELSPIL